MADENELRELCERIASLSGRDQARLLEMVLVENRRQYEEILAENLRQDATLRELERQRAIAGVAGEKREAG